VSQSARKSSPKKDTINERLSSRRGSVVRDLAPELRRPGLIDQATLDPEAAATIVEQRELSALGQEALSLVWRMKSGDEGDPVDTSASPASLLKRPVDQYRAWQVGDRWQVGEKLATQWQQVEKPSQYCKVRFDPQAHVSDMHRLRQRFAVSAGTELQQVLAIIETATVEGSKDWAVRAVARVRQRTPRPSMTTTSRA
jgi:hypothetical protein